jgi:phage major head subunit gpT-like protein
MIPQVQRSNFTDLFLSTMLPVLDELFAFNYAQYPMLRDQIFNKKSSNSSISQYSEVHDLPQFSSLSEGADYTFHAPKQGYDKTFTHTKYALGFSISEEAVDDGKFDFIKDAIVKMAKSAKETQEQSGMNIFNNGFSSETTADGIALFATNHTTPTGTYTIANKPATDADLDFSSLSEAISAFRTAFRGDSGIYHNLSPRVLLVPTGLELYARQLVESSLKADSANNNINPFHLALKVMSSPHLTDADAWFLIGDKVDHGLDLIIRKPVETIPGGMSVGYINDVIPYKARYRESIGATRPHGVYGTTGA